MISSFVDLFIINPCQQGKVQDSPSKKLLSIFSWVGSRYELSPQLHKMDNDNVSANNFGIMSHLGEFMFSLDLFSYRGTAQRLALAAGCHENQPTKRNNVFEREKAAKRNVANCPLQAMLARC